MHNPAAWQGRVGRWLSVINLLFINPPILYHSRDNPGRLYLRAFRGRRGFRETGGNRRDRL